MSLWEICQTKLANMICETHDSTKFCAEWFSIHLTADKCTVRSLKSQRDDPKPTNFPKRVQNSPLIATIIIISVLIFSIGVLQNQISELKSQNTDIE